MAAINQFWVDELDDEVTSELTLLGSLVSSPVALVEQATSLAEVQRILLEHKVPAVAVIDDTDTLQGLVTRNDLLRALARTAGGEPVTTAGQAMSGILSLGHDTTVECAAALMVLESVWQIVVTSSDGDLVGLVSAVDIARHVAVRAGYLAA